MQMERHREAIIVAKVREHIFKRTSQAAGVMEDARHIRASWTQKLDELVLQLSYRNVAKVRHARQVSPLAA
jgi:hypothetical protein